MLRIFDPSLILLDLRFRDQVVTAIIPDSSSEGEVREGAHIYGMGIKSDPTWIERVETRLMLDGGLLDWWIVDWWVAIHLV